MALTGSFTYYETELSNTLSESVHVTYPTSIPENDPNYDKRGTEEDIWVSSSIQTATTISGSYLMIYAAALTHDIYNPEYRRHNLNITYNVYDSQATAWNESGEVNVYEDYLYKHCEEMVNITLNQLTGSANIMEYAYEHLKTLDGFEDMIDA